MASGLALRSLALVATPRPGLTSVGIRTGVRALVLLPTGTGGSPPSLQALDFAPNVSSYNAMLRAYRNAGEVVKVLAPHPPSPCAYPVVRPLSVPHPVTYP